MKQFLYDFIWTLAIGLILYLGMQLQAQVAEKSQMTFTIFPLQAYIALFPVAIGVPALYIVLMTFLPFSPLGEGWLSIPNILLFGGTTVPTVAGLVFGYVVLACFKVVNLSNSKATY
ncbi:hypothetical protein BBH88_11120 [Planococcus antarcticus DSM 14505]|uniref:Uncharacterized protein n=1 Tax=Planococcus antarcticus DSM 14505 TaxID=1185653 RepID=A0ABM6D797_9BACL|nr:hypothetical protein [Planococcus antarcticus]ANU10821.1 hypothetical protein BBH88_11120 [Planococcus antarcticus DSM 14505]